MSRIMPTKSRSESARCSGCAGVIKTTLNAKLHPLLKVLICGECLEAYGTGDFSIFPDGVDENGDDNFCRVCVDGGDLFFCDVTAKKCHYAFCRDCIQRIYPQDTLLKRDTNMESNNHIENNNDNDFENNNESGNNNNKQVDQAKDETSRWTCLACAPTKTFQARRDASAAIERLKSLEAKKSAGTDHNYTSVTKKRKTEAQMEKADRVEDAKEAAKSKGKSTEISGKGSSHSKAKDKSNGVSKPTSSSGPAKLASTSARDPKTWNGASSSSSSSASSSVAADKSVEVAKLKDKRREEGVSREKKRAEEKRAGVGEPDKPLVGEKKKVMQSVKLTSVKEKTKSLKTSEPAGQKEPEASILPPLEKPQQASSSLKSLNAPRVSFCAALATSTPIERHQPIKTRTSVQRTPLLPKQSILRSTTPKAVPVRRESVETSILLADKELRCRLAEFKAMKDLHLRKVDRHFSDIAEHFFTINPKVGSELMRDHIDSMRRSIQEVNNMFVNLETLWAAREREQQ